MTIQPSCVHIVDDEQELSREFAKILESVGLNVETYSSGLDFLNRYKPGSPGCVVTDIKMPDLSGPDLQDLLIEIKDPIPVIFISGYADVSTAVMVMGKGARYLFEKGASTYNLVSAIQKAVDEDIKARASYAQQAEIYARYSSLSGRERDILHALLKGLTNKEMGEAFGISPNTVEIHRARVKSKMKAESLADLMRMCLMNNLGPSS